MPSGSKAQTKRSLSIDGSDSEHSEIALASLSRKKMKSIGGLYTQPEVPWDANTSNIEKEMAKVRLGGPPPSHLTVPICRPSLLGSVRSASDPPANNIYSISDDELEEVPDLQLVGEVASQVPGQEDLPVRLLSDFCIYEVESREIVDIQNLLFLAKQSPRTRYGASGVVQPYIEEDDFGDDEDEDEDDIEIGEQHLMLSDIIEFNIYHVKQGNVDDKMYLKTEYAWYILDMPSSIYKPFYSDFYIKHHIVCLVVSVALDDPRTTLPEFLAGVRDGCFVHFDTLFKSIVGRALLPTDFQLEDMASYLLSSLLDLGETYGLKSKLAASALFKSFTNTSGHFASSTSSLVTRKRSVLSLHQNWETTVVTPTIYQIAVEHFLQQFTVVGHSLTPDPVSCVPEEFPKAHHGNPKKIQWVEAGVAKGYYQSVMIEGVLYSVGDIVAVAPGSDADPTRAKHALTSSTQSKIALANEMWFCQIIYFFQGEKKMFHARWLEHSSKTLLEELGNPHTLFFSSYECKDLDLWCIYCKVHAHHLREGEEQPIHQDGMNFHYGLVWDRHKTSFTYTLPSEISQAMALCDQPRACLSCGMQLKIGASCHQESHANDFVYLLPSSMTQDPDCHIEPYLIGQIVNLGPSNLTLEIYAHFNSVVKQLPAGYDFPDERQLVSTGKILKVKRSQVAGYCHVIHPDVLDPVVTLDDWLSQDDHFFVMNTLECGVLKEMPPEGFRFCAVCHQKQVLEIQQYQLLLAKNQPLQALELFSGAGGLSTGFSTTPYIQTKWAVELSNSAAMTYQENHKDTIVYQTSTNQLLKTTIMAHESKKDAIFLSSHDEKRMPIPGEVDFIYGGPPCQSFSGANYNKRPDDPRSALIANFMAWVEYYQPSYFLIENVTGILNHRLKAEKVNNHITGGIEMGMVKFIMRAATALGYQVHCKILQAAQYGSPQGRERVIFIGSKGLTPLPRFPLPTHCFPKRVKQRKTVTGNPITGVDRLSEHTDVMSAPFGQVTIEDAINDLPPFDWVNPHKILQPTRGEQAEANAQHDRGIEQCVASDASHTEYAGFPDPVPYASKPMNDYQQWMRKGKGEKVSGHYTRLFTPVVVERVVNIPLHPNADHENLPHSLQGTKIQSGDTKKLKGLYSRLDGKSHFATALTKVTPTAKPGGKVLHPSQKRIITVRECARAQGFPDDYIFVTEGKTGKAKVEDQTRQIGNAVPVPLGKALGNAIGASLLQVWAEHERDGSPEI
ncbi:S-adenosyl-L-methionine-dependent methyltransferase [Neolentinus lepideus HHB14362 ss-1]|uniref:Cytosine-specific methyltransferase n=1 Tax=Neolentinus lepideus HHB14362 ss-1 TaxID=1314782 RepID=A0A165TX46_9AGAM|nr:S-adenosyl-L-methionine-dependent methyltransferase [Neolentinus lepideus HHB14362 ss-1]